MIFQHTLPLLVNGQKTQTRRVVKSHETAHTDSAGQIIAVRAHGRIKWAVGKTYAIQPGRAQRAVGHIRLTGIRCETADAITQNDAVAEGFADRDAFLQTWRDIHGANADHCRVWALTFEIIEIAVDGVEHKLG